MRPGRRYAERRVRRTESQARRHGSTMARRSASSAAASWAPGSRRSRPGPAATCVRRGRRRGRAERRWRGSRSPSAARGEAGQVRPSADREAALGARCRFTTDLAELADRDSWSRRSSRTRPRSRRSSRARQDRAPRRAAGQQHVVHPDHEARVRDPHPQRVIGHALLQPGAGAAARRARAEPAHLPGDRARAPRRSPSRGSASTPCCARTAPASSSTPC